MSFRLDSRIEESSHFIEDWELCRVQLKNDKTWPWLQLIPRRENIREIHALSSKDQEQLMREVTHASQAIETIYKPSKINIAALGNMVPQLHVHIFARFESDIAWPKPVWAVQTSEIPYTESEKKAEIEKFRAYFHATLKKG